jgi:hypothetical protein
MDPHNPPALAVADHDTSLSVEGEGIRLTPIFQMFGIIVVLLAVAVSLVFNWAPDTRCCGKPVPRPSSN